MAFAWLGKPLPALLLSIFVLSLWAGQYSATQQTVAQPHLTCALNQTAEAQFEGDLARAAGRPWLQGDPQLREAHGRSLEKAYELFMKDQNGNEQCVSPGKGPGPKTSGREKVRPKVFKTEHALEGEDAILVCESHSDPAIDYWDWYRHHDVEGDVLLVNGTDQRIFITHSAHRSELLLRHLNASEDPGQYICVGTNREGYYAAVVRLRVHSHLAALWPFLGIVFEILVLFAIILFDEHSRTLAEELAEN